MEVRVGDAVLLVRLVDGKVRNHAAGDEVVQQKLPSEGDILVERKLVLQRDVEAVGGAARFCCAPRPRPRSRASAGLRTRVERAAVAEFPSESRRLCACSR